MFAFFRRHILLALFFGFLAIYLFLGDGQQLLIDTIATGGTLILVLGALLYGTKKRSFPRIPLLLWSGYLLYSSVRTFFSDDIGYSVYTVIRMMDMFLISYTLYCYTTEDDRRVFPKFLLGFVLFSLGSSLVYTLVPALRDTLPNTNLLVPTYGHNHVVDILLFGIPIAFFSVLQGKNTKWYFIVLVGLLGGLVFSFARAAMFLVGMFLFIHMFFLWKNISSRKKAVFIFLIAGAGLLFSMMFIIPQSLYQKYMYDALIPQMAKKSISADGRLEYFRQATVAITERPVFGSGPGTFILQSKRLQHLPESYARHAHNIFLEEWVTTGVVGVVCFLSIIFWYVWSSIQKKKKQKENDILYWICGLVFLYSLLDFVLSFFVVQALWWATLTMLFIDERSSRDTSLFSRTVLMVWVLIVSIFYVLQFTTLTGWIPKTGTYSPLFLLGEGMAINYLKEQDALSEDVVQTTIHLHQKNPNVLLSICTETNTSFTTQACRDVFSIDKQNKKNIDDIISHALETKDADKLVALLHEIKPQEISLNLSDDRLKILYRTLPDLSGIALYSVNESLFFSQLLYAMGFAARYTYPDITRIAWQDAYMLSPHWSYFALELASIYAEQGDKAQADAVLSFCIKDRYAQQDCRLYQKKVLPEPGTFYLPIFAIPH